MSDTNGPLDTSGAARHMGMSKSTLEKLRVFGGGPRFLKLGRTVRYRSSDLDAWMGERLVTSTSDPAHRAAGQWERGGRSR